MEITRRNFISLATKILTGAAVFGIAPNLTEAAEKVSEEKIIPLEETFLDPVKEAKEILPFEIPHIRRFKPLAELKIGGQNLNFVNFMDKRHFTSAIVVHHAGMTYNGDMSLKAIHDLHLSNGWAGVGYHFIVHPNGTIDRARPIDRIGAHAYAHNRYTVGICMTGNFDIGVPTADQILSTEMLVAALCHHYDIIPTRQTIFGHRDLCDTSCPGYNFYPRLPELIGNVERALRRA